MKLKTTIMLLVVLLVINTLLYSLLSAKALGDLAGALNSSTSDARQYASAINVSRQAQVNFQRQVQEWKDVLIRGNEPELYDRHLKAFLAREKAVEDGLAELKRLFGEVRMNPAPIDLLIAEHHNLGQAYRKALASFDPRDRQSGQRVDREIRGIDRPASMAMDDLADRVERDAGARLSQARADSEQESHDAHVIFGVAALVTLLVTAGLCAKIGRDVLRAVGAEPADLVHSFDRIAHGDLSASLPLRDDDETSLAASARLMQQRVRAMIVAIKQGAAEVAAAADRAAAAGTPAEATESLKRARKAMAALDAAADRFRT